MEVDIYVIAVCESRALPSNPFYHAGGPNFRHCNTIDDKKVRRGRNVVDRVSGCDNDGGQT